MSFKISEIARQLVGVKIRSLPGDKRADEQTFVLIGEVELRRRLGGADPSKAGEEQVREALKDVLQKNL